MNDLEAAEILEHALEGLVRFVRMWDEKPLRGRDPDLIYAIHTGTEWEAELRVSDLRAAIAGANHE